MAQGDKTLSFPSGIAVLGQKHLDPRNGPTVGYTDLADARASIPEGQRVRGLSVYIQNGEGGVDRYWFRDGIGDGDLVKELTQDDIDTPSKLANIMGPNGEGTLISSGPRLDLGLNSTSWNNDGSTNQVTARVNISNTTHNIQLTGNVDVNCVHRLFVTKDTASDITLTFSRTFGSFIYLNSNVLKGPVGSVHLVEIIGSLTNIVRFTPILEETTGQLSALQTTAKNTLVAAINELKAAIAGLGNLTDEDIDTLAELNAILTDANLASQAWVENYVSENVKGIYKYVQGGDGSDHFNDLATLVADLPEYATVVISVDSATNDTIPSLDINWKGAKIILENTDNTNSIKLAGDCTWSNVRELSGVGYMVILNDGVATEDIIFTPYKKEITFKTLNGLEATLQIPAGGAMVYGEGPVIINSIVPEVAEPTGITVFNPYGSIAFNEIDGDLIITKYPIKEQILVLTEIGVDAAVGTSLGAKWRPTTAINIVELVVEVMGEAPSGTDLLTVDVNAAGASILSTKITVDSGEYTSATATTPADFSTTEIAARTLISADIDQVGNTTSGQEIYLKIRYTE